MHHAESDLTLRHNHWGTVAAAAFSLSVLFGCIPNGEKAYAIKATVSGLKGNGLELWMNGHDPALVDEDGEVILAYMVGGYDYNVSVKTQPTSPAQTCTVANASGVMGSVDVTDVKVTCITTYGIGGTVSGLAGTGLVLNNKLGDSTAGEDLPISENGSFVFPTRAAAQTKYMVSAKIPPETPDQTCSVEENASGTVVDSDILNVKVTCSTNAYAVSGKVKNLAEGTTVVLRNNGVDLPVTNSTGVSEVDFSFTVADGAAYAVAVETQPTNPWQECIVDTGTGSGRVNGQAVTTVDVTCKINSYSIGGSISGLAGTGLVLTTNGEDLNVDANSAAFLFRTQLPSLTAYDVKVKTQPTNLKQFCTVKDGTGAIQGDNVTNIIVNCLSLVAVGQNVAASSPDGIVWTSRDIPTGNYFSVAWNGSVFVAVGEKVAARSQDGVIWTASTIPAMNYHALAWNGSIFVAVGHGDNIATSPDGITWTEGSIPWGWYHGLAWNGSVFVAVGHDDMLTTSYISTSPNGLNWTARITPGVYEYETVTWGGSAFVAVGVGAAATSPDGINNWTSRSIPNGSFWSVASNGSVLVAPAALNVAVTSPDGAVWTTQTIPDGAFKGIAWNGSAFVSVGVNVAATTSSDGLTWSSHSIPVGTYNAVVSVW